MRKTIKKRQSIARSVSDFKKKFVALESSERAITLDACLPNERVQDVAEKVTYDVNPIYTSIDMKKQVREVRGFYVKNNVETHEYHTPLYKDLLTKVFPLRVQFRKERDNQARKEIAKTEFDAWNGYFQTRKQEVANLKVVKEVQEADIDYIEKHKDTALHFEHTWDEKEMARFEEFFDRFKVSFTILI